MKVSRRLWIAVAIVVLLLYQVPNLALVAYKGGMSIASTDVLGIEMKVTNGWYPIAASNSVLGRALLPAGGPHLVAFQRPSLIWPWRGELFAVMSYEKPIDASSVELVKQTTWGQAMLLKKNPTSDPTQRLFAIPSHRVGVLVNDQAVLDDIVMLKRIERTAKLD